MSTVSEVLRQHGYRAPEATVAAALSELLAPDDPAAVDLSAADKAYLARYGDVRKATPDQLEALDARSGARATVEAAAALTRAEVAGLLGVDPSRVSHQTTSGHLLAYRGSAGRPVYPDWQFAASTALPHLREVLAAIPTGSHPIPLRSFMTTPDDELAVEGRSRSPRDWLLSGGDPQPVIALAATLGEQV